MTMRRYLYILVAILLMPPAAVPCQGLSKKDRAVKKRVRPYVESMSLRDKVAQLVFVDVYPDSDSAYQARADSVIAREQVGGVILMEGGIEQTAGICNRLQSLVRLPLAVSVDGEFGLGMRISEFRRYPRQGALASLPDDSLIYEMGRQIARDMRALKIDINFAPVVDVNLHPDVNTIRDRSFGPDKRLVAEYGSAFMRGMQDGGAVACAKHFPGHGDTEVDSHKALPVLKFPIERLDSVELYPFRKLIKDGVDMVMVGHLLVPALDTLPASVSRTVVTDLLRKKMNFNGLIITDALGMEGVLAPFGGACEKVMLAAYKAGVDILLMPGNVSEGIGLIVDYIGNDRKRIKDLDERVTRVLALKDKCGKLSESYDRRIEPESVDTSSTEALVTTIEDVLAKGKDSTR